MLPAAYHLLPTLPKAWKDGKVTHCRLYSPTPRPVKVKVNGKLETVKVEQA